jgi:peptidoglycan/xylan/chitin deacetylase (PgdA/CDA1 family)
MNVDRGGARRLVAPRTVAACAAFFMCAAAALASPATGTPGGPILEAADTAECVRRHGGFVRGPADRPRLALVFTAHEYAEGGDHILDVLSRRGLRAAFFVTGDFARAPEFAPLMRRMVRDGHLLAPHSDKHLLYATWEPPHASLVTRDELRRDLQDNVTALAPFTSEPDGRKYWIPSYEWFNAETVTWARELGYETVTFTPGTRANADYTGEADKNFVSSDRIVASIRERAAHPDRGMNGFVLLMHLGAGPRRADKLHVRLDEILDLLRDGGYQVVPLAELLAGCE